jgi:hypothetical protein
LLGKACGTYGGDKNCIQNLVGRPKGKKESLRRPRCRWDVAWILGKWGGREWTGFIWLGIGMAGGSSEHSKLLVGSMKDRNLTSWASINFSRTLFCGVNYLQFYVL